MLLTVQPSSQTVFVCHLSLEQSDDFHKAFMSTISTYCYYYFSGKVKDFKSWFFHPPLFEFGSGKVVIK